jgi:protocatechuate 3,4-dioxygenase beta subunit
LRVFDSTGQTPIPRAAVHVTVGFHTTDWRETDERGCLDIVHSTGPHDAKLYVDVMGDGYAEQRHLWGQDPGDVIPDQATILLQPGVTLGGIVNDEDGRPIAGATILLWAIAPQFRKKDPHELLYDLRAITGPDGHWQTRSAPEMTGELSVRAIHPDYVSDRDYSNREHRFQFDALRAQSAALVMRKGISVEGRVLDHDGQPVPGASVIPAVDPRHQIFAWLEEFTVKTNSEGRFKLSPYSAGRPLTLIARAPGHAPALQTIHVDVGTAPLDLRLGLSRTIRGTVADIHGHPIAGVNVQVENWLGCSCLGVELWSDAQGQFLWNDAPLDPFVLRATKDTYLTARSPVLKPVDDEIIFILERSAVLRGLIRDADTGELVKTCAVEVGVIDPNTGKTAWFHQLGVLARAGKLDATITVEGTRFRLRVTAPGYKPFVSREIRPGEVEPDFPVSLEPEAVR